MSTKATTASTALLMLQMMILTTDANTTTTTTTTSSSTSSSSHQQPQQQQWVVIVCFLVITIQLLRFAIDLIRYASISAYGPSVSPLSAAAAAAVSIDSLETNKQNGSNNSSSSKNASETTPTTTGVVSYSSSIITTVLTTAAASNYGAIPETSNTTTTTTTPTSNNHNDDEEEMRRPLVSSSGGNATASSLLSSTKQKTSSNSNGSSYWTVFVMTVWCCMAILYIVPHFIVTATIPTATTTISTSTCTIYTTYGVLLYISSISIVMEMVLYVGFHSKQDRQQQQRYGMVQYTLHQSVPLLLWMTYTILYLQQQQKQSSSLYQWWSTRASCTIDLGLVVLTTLYVVFTMMVGHQITKHQHRDISSANGPSKSITTITKKKKLSKSAIYILVKPYVWPDAVIVTGAGDSSSSALSWETSMNRFRAIATWVCVIVSKYCSLISPLYLGWASTALAHADYTNCIKYTIYYNFISFLSSTFKEGQSLMYLKVKQAAFVQLSQTAFGHLHSLSLDWHLRKKLGEVLRSMDRGISACDTLMNYIFLWLIPAIAECIAVCVIFATYFQYLPLAITVFYFVFAYIVWTLLLTVWRRKFRKALVLHDNEWHDRFTDSMINFETVKFFTAEQYEKERFASAVRKYQVQSVDVQSSLSMLNISQQAMLKACLATALSLAAIGIRKRVDCCVETMGCDSGISDCCRSISQNVCPGMQVGDFVAVLTYTLSLFAPLNFLGSVYNTIVMAMVDLGNMSELLAESPDVTDSPDAMTLPRTNTTDPNVAIEFDNVYFNYPSQSKERGLKGLSFTIKPGTTTAIVGPTGAGKTTVSRLLFRFYDVLGGAVKVNGVDVRAITQHSLRDGIGVVPQAASMFNDTIRSNILYGRRDATEEELVQAARDAQLLGFIESLNEGWETLVGDRGLKLSGGEKQRAAIARCLLKNPPFILLDEATASLDTLTENSVQIALDRLGAQRTVLVIAHRLGTIRNADKIIVLKEGRAFEEGTHDELLLKNGLYAEMWNMQLHSTSTTTSQSNLLSVAES